MRRTTRSGGRAKSCGSSSDPFAIAALIGHPRRQRTCRSRQVPDSRRLSRRVSCIASHPRYGVRMNTPRVEDDHEVILVQGLCAELIDERLRSVCRLADVGHRATAFYLADLHSRGLHQALGMPTTVTYAVRSLGMSRWQARAMTSSQDELDRLVRSAHRGDAPPSGGGPFRVLVREGDASSAPTLVGRDGEEALPAACLEAIAGEGATPPRLRARVLARDGHACRNCGSHRALHAHHVIWRSRGGPTVLDNLQTLCNSLSWPGARRVPRGGSGAMRHSGSGSGGLRFLRRARATGRSARLRWSEGQSARRGGSRGGAVRHLGCATRHRRGAMRHRRRAMHFRSCAERHREFAVAFDRCPLARFPPRLVRCAGRWVHVEAAVPRTVRSGAGRASGAKPGGNIRGLTSGATMGCRVAAARGTRRGLASRPATRSHPRLQTNV